MLRAKGEQAGQRHKGKMLKAGSVAANIKHLAVLALLWSAEHGTSKA